MLVYNTVVPADSAAVAAQPDRSTAGMAAFEGLQRELAVRSDLEVVQHGQELRISPRFRGGFVIRMRMYGRSCTVHFGDCDQDFDDIGMARFWVLRAVSPDYRLRKEQQGGRTYEWSLEPCSGDRVGLSGGFARPWAWPWPFNSEAGVVCLSFGPRTAAQGAALVG